MSQSCYGLERTLGIDVVPWSKRAESYTPVRLKSEGEVFEPENGFVELV